MAVYTISNTGGIFASASTWIGGVVPTSADSIIGTASSGPLTVNVNVSIVSMNFTTYTNTLTLNNNISLNGGAGLNYFGTNCTYTGTGWIQLLGVNFSMGSGVANTISATVSHLYFSGNGTKTLTSDINCMNLTMLNIGASLGNTNYVLRVKGTASMGVNGTGGTLTGSSRIIFDGPDNRWLQGAASNGFSVSSPVEIASTGTFKIGSITAGKDGWIFLAGSSATTPGSTTSTYLKYTSGTVSSIGPSNKTTLKLGSVSQATTTVLTLDTDGMTWDEVYINDWTTQTAVNTTAWNYYLTSNLNFSEMTWLGLGSETIASTLQTSKGQIKFSGPGRLNGGSLLMRSNLFQLFAAANVYPDNMVYLNPTLMLTPGPTHSISNLYSYGQDDANKVLIRSATASTTAYLTITSPSTSRVVFTDFTDISNTGSTQFVVGATLSNTSGFINTTIGAVGGSYTFVN